MDCHLNPASTGSPTPDHRLFFEGLWSCSSDNMFVVRSDESGELVIDAVNPHMARRCAGRDSHLLGRPLAELVPAQRREEVVARYRECLRRRTPLSFDAPGLGGRSRATWRTLLIPVADGEGEMVRIYAVSRNITPLKWAQRLLRGGRAPLMARHQHLLRTNAVLRKLATIDHLTHSYNRRHFFELATQAFQLARRHNRDLCALMVDIDLFKGVNDRYGHAVGDRTIEAVAGACRAGLRASDILGRYGGEEFSILLPDTPLTDARRVAEKIRLNVEQSVLETEKGPVRATVSVGVASLEATDTTLESLLERADRALFRAKQRGRNRVECYLCG